jgi:hypothetical protein
MNRNSLRTALQRTALQRTALQRTALTLGLASLLACGGRELPPDVGRSHVRPDGEDLAHQGEDAEHGGGGHSKHDNLTGPVKDIHDVFAPIWHMERGDERMKKACDAVSELLSRTRKLSEDPSAAKKAAAKDLSDKLDALAVDCAKTPPANFDALFSTAHDALHALMEAK